MTDLKTSPANCSLFIKIINLATGAVLIGFGIAGIVYMAVNSLTSGKFFLFFSPVFMIIFGIMIIAAQFRIKAVIEHFSFLQTLIGRGIFNIYLASSVFYYFSCDSNNSVVGWIMGIILFAMGILYFFLHCCGGSGYAQEIKQQMM